MNAFALASRNLLRNQRRSLMTLVAMVLGLTTVLVFGGYIRDINYAMQTDFVRRSGHLQVQHKDYFRIGSGNPEAYGVRGYEELIASLRQDPELASMLLVVTPTLQFGGIAGNFAAGVSRTVLVTGVVVEDQNRLREWNDYGQRLIARPLALSGTAPDAAVIGTGVARVLQLCADLDVPDCAAPTRIGPAGESAMPDDIAALTGTTKSASAARASGRGSSIEILATTPRGAPNVAVVTVDSAEFQGIKELDEVYVGLHLAQAQNLIFGAAPPQVSAIAIQLRHTRQIPAARARIEGLLRTVPGGDALAVIDYEVLNPYYGQTLRMFAAIFGFISILIGAIVLFTVSNTMSMAIVERTAEIGTLRAIGVRQAGIRKMFLAEGVILGFVGAVLGILVSIGVAWCINRLGLTWIPPGRIDEIPLAVQMAGQYGMIVLNAVALVTVAAVSALVPATRASRMNIVEALRHV